MKRNFLILFLLLNIHYVNAQISGIKTIPGDYATIGAAITAINSSGIGSGGVTFNVAANHTENIPSGGYVINTTTSSSSNPIIFQKSGTGANPKLLSLAAGSGTINIGTYGNNGDAFIKIDRTDYVTFDGIDLTEQYAGTSGTQIMEYGFLLVKTATDACSNIKIQNCLISLSRSRIYTIGIYQANFSASGTSVTVSSVGGNCNGNSYNGNTIQSYHGIRCNGYNSIYSDIGTQIGTVAGNNFSAFGGLSNSANVYVMDLVYQKNIEIAQNIINGGVGTTNSTSPWPTIYGINVGSGSDNPLTSIHDNSITINVGSGEANITAINVSGGGYSLGPTHNTTVNIMNNTISNCNTNTIYMTLQGIIQSSAYDFITISNNTVSNNTGGHVNQLISNTNNASGFNAEVNLFKNTITGNTSTYNSTSPTSSYLLRTQSVGTALLKVYENTVANHSSGSDYVYVSWITSGSTSPAEARFYKNNLYNINSTGNSSFIYGIYVSSGLTTQISNNFISGLKCTSTSQNNAISGFYITSSATNANIEHNSFSISASSTGTNFGTYGIYADANSNLKLINNIISNNSVARGSGKTIAYGRTNTSLANYNAASNNNLFYAGTPSATNLIFFDQTNSDQTITSYKTRVNPIDNNSVSENPEPFFTSTYDLHLGNCNSCIVENAGILIAAVSDDIDHQSRNNPPEIGADEKTSNLPVEMSFFETYCADDSTVIHWITQSEINNNLFSIYKKDEFGQLKSIKTIPGNGNSNSPIEYFCKISAKENEILGLFQTDFNANQACLNWFTINCMQNDNNIEIYPNPTSSMVYFHRDSKNTDEIIFVQAYDIRGNLVFNENISVMGVIDVSSWPNGCYHLFIQWNEFRMSKKLLILR